MKVYLLRHAKAGDRAGWDGDDDLRPLTKPGRRQVEALIDALDSAAIKTIVSSPSVRCRQSVEPLAQRWKLPVELSDALAEGAPITEALGLIDKVSHEPSLLCTHGDIVGGVIDHLQQRGVAIEEFRLEKASIWVLDVDAGVVTTATYWTPPES